MLTPSHFKSSAIAPSPLNSVGPPDGMNGPMGPNFFPVSRPSVVRNRWTGRTRSHIMHVFARCAQIFRVTNFLIHLPDTVADWRLGCGLTRTVALSNLSFQIFTLGNFIGSHAFRDLSSDPVFIYDNANKTWYRRSCLLSYHTVYTNR